MSITRIPLTDMNAGEVGTVVECTGKGDTCRRLRLLGIRIGMKIKKVSAFFKSGPTVVQIGNAQAALGHKVGHKVIVEVKR